MEKGIFWISEVIFYITVKITLLQNAHKIFKAGPGGGFGLPPIQGSSLSW